MTMWGVLFFLFVVAGIGAVILFFTLGPAGNGLEAPVNLEEKKPQEIKESDYKTLRQGNYIELGLIPRTRKPYILTEKARLMHIANRAPTGKGKTYKELQTFLMQDIARRDNAIVVFDPLKDITNEIISMCKANNRSYLVYPYCGFNPLSGWGNATVRAAMFADLFYQLSPIGQNGGDAVYYKGKGKEFVQIAMPLFEVTYGIVPTLRELQLLIVSEGYRQKMLAKAPPSEALVEYNLVFGDWQQDKFEKLDNLKMFITDLFALPDMKYCLNKRNAPTLQEAIRDKKVIIIRAGGVPGTVEGNLGLLFMASLQAYLLKRGESGDPMHFLALYIDETPFYLTPNFRMMVTTARHAFASLFLSFQSKASFGDYADIISDNLNTHIIQNGLGEKEAKEIVEMFGEDLHIVTSTNTPHDIGRGSGSTSRSFQYLPTTTVGRIRNISQDQFLLISTNPLRHREVDAARMLDNLPNKAYEEMLLAYPFQYVPPTVPPYAPAPVFSPDFDPNE